MTIGIFIKIFILGENFKPNLSLKKEIKKWILKKHDKCKKLKKNKNK